MENNKNSKKIFDRKFKTKRPPKEKRPSNNKRTRSITPSRIKTLPNASPKSEIKFDKNTIKSIQKNIYENGKNEFLKFALDESPKRT